MLNKIREASPRKLQHIIHTIGLGIRYRSRVKDILGNLADTVNNQSTQRYIKDHGLKTAFGLGVYHEINTLAGIENNDEIESVALYSQIIWTNLDKILDHLKPGDPRFLSLLEHFTARVLGENPTTQDPLLDHPKLQELVLMTDEIRRILQDTPERQSIEKIIRNLAQAVSAQRSGDLSYMREPNQNMSLGSVSTKIEQSGIPIEVHPYLYLSIELGVYTFLSSFAIGLSADSGSDDQRNHIKAYIISYAAFIQLYDDFLDRKKDQEANIMTYATKFPNYTIQYARLLQTWKKSLIQEFHDSPYPLPKSLLAGLELYDIMNTLGPKDRAKNPPYDLPL